MSRHATELPILESDYLVPFDKSFKISDATTRPPDDRVEDKRWRHRLSETLIPQLDHLQRVLYAYDRRALLLIFQGMDASGKDGTIRAVMSGVNPAGCEVYSFKEPSSEELAHDFLWRTAKRLPEAGRIGLFNRSYYEDVVIVRVHPNLLDRQIGAEELASGSLWAERYQSIRDHELHLFRSGTVIVKFWLNISRSEQRRRFLSRLDDPRKHWKFSTADITERAHWGAYMAAYEEALNETSRPWAPWYALPADDKPYLHYCVADIVVRTLESMQLRYPQFTAEQASEVQSMRKLLDE